MTATACFLSTRSRLASSCEGEKSEETYRGPWPIIWVLQAGDTLHQKGIISAELLQLLALLPTEWKSQESIYRGLRNHIGSGVFV